MSDRMTSPDDSSNNLPLIEHPFHPISTLPSSSGTRNPQRPQNQDETPYIKSSPIPSLVPQKSNLYSGPYEEIKLIDQLKISYENLLKKHTTLCISFDKKNEKLNNLIKNCTKLEKDLHTIKRENLQLRNDNKTIYKKYSDEKKEKEYLQSKNHKMTEQIKILNIEKSNNSISILELKKKRDDFRIKKNKLTTQINAQKEELERNVKLLEGMEEKCQSKNDKLEGVQQDVLSVAAVHHNFKMRVKDLLVSYENEVGQKLKIINSKLNVD